MLSRGVSYIFVFPSIGDFWMQISLYLHRFFKYFIKRGWWVHFRAIMRYNSAHARYYPSPISMVKNKSSMILKAWCFKVLLRQLRVWAFNYKCLVIIRMVKSGKIVEKPHEYCLYFNFIKVRGIVPPVILL